MRIAVISDIHGNVDALKKTIASIKNSKVDKIFCLGDIMGYLYDPFICIELIQHNNIICLQGNHDKYFVDFYYDRKNIFNYTKKYGSSFLHLLKEVKSAHLTFLKNLPTKIEITLNNKKFFFCHANHKNNFDYINEENYNHFLKLHFIKNFDYFIFGHTHTPFKKKINTTHILNPGSIGLPRQNKSLFSNWMLIDISNSEIFQYEEKYNSNSVINKILKYDNDNNYLMSYCKK